MSENEIVKENKELSIEVKNVTKIYSLYKRPSDRLIDTFHLMPWRKYPKNPALNDVSFSVAKGETVGIIGTNGSGKSTVLKIITGVLTPTKGKATVKGRISALLELGAGFNAEYTGIENVYLNGTMMGLTREEIDAKLPEILAFADIGDYVYSPV
ncbi:MAG: ATP-binding cassette domain-containing protein, partial [Lachnospiraceae bacterium]|nr:ATP-binding cassette domain-containing protein [Lachnospiraceae bacterium]